jgi:glutathione peroxidase
MPGAGLDRAHRESALTSVYGFQAILLQGAEISLSQFKGQVLLVVNTACNCGFTPQYEGLQILYEKYHAQGLTILGFPCNQFGQQEPGGGEEIRHFCRSNFGVSFPIFSKIDVNGANAHPLYRYLTREKRGLLGTANIKWNFTKFLIDRSGGIVARHSALTSPESLEEPIKRLL